VARKESEYIQFKLQISEGLRRRLERQGAKKGLTANAEAVEILERSFEQQETTEQIKDVLQPILRETEVKIEQLTAQLTKLPWSAVMAIADLVDRSVPLKSTAKGLDRSSVVGSTVKGEEGNVNDHQADAAARPD
jgi:hypothetical protein